MKNKKQKSTPPASRPGSSGGGREAAASRKLGGIRGDEAGVLGKEQTMPQPPEGQEGMNG